jgi:uncharacterized protein YggE
VEDYLEVTGTGTAGAVPDLVVLSLRVERSAPDVAAALEACSAAAGALLGALGDEGVARTDVQTASVRMEPWWDQRGGRRAGSSASQDLTVRLHDAERVGQVVARCVEAAGNALQVQGLDWSFEDGAQVRRQARELAWYDALAKAEHLAGLSARRLGPVLGVRETDGTYAASPAAFDAVAASAVESMPTSAGETTTTAVLVVRWRLT